MTKHNALFLSPVLMAAQPSPDGGDAAVPEWIHLLPLDGSGLIQTDDARGPYTAADLQAIIDVSFHGTDRLIIDQDHATDKAAPQGLPAPARGWIVEMQARADGIWGRVEWTREGAALVASRAYRAISPVVLHEKGKKHIWGIPRASLVNRPNFKGLVALNSPQEEYPMNKIAEALGLKPDADEAAILSAITAMQKKPEPDVAMQASLQSAQSAMAAMQAQVAELTTSLNAREEADKRGRATAFVDAELARLNPAIKADTKDYYVSLHMADPTGTEKALSAIPALGATGMSAAPPTVLKDGETSLNASDLDAARLLGIAPEAFVAARKKDAI